MQIAKGFLALALALSLSGQAFAAGAEGRSIAGGRTNGTQVAQEITVRVCNRSSDNAVIARSYIPVGGSSWYNEGWLPVPIGQCRVVLHTKNSIFLLRGEVLNNGRTFWGSGPYHCVIYPGPFGFYENSGTECDYGQTAVQFSQLQYQGNMPGEYLWTLKD